MSNYPPGVTGGEDYFNPPDTAHDHHFEVTEDSPIFEDGAAIVREECVHETVLNSEEGYRGERIATETIECDEHNLIWFEPISVLHLESDDIYRKELDEWEDGDGNLLLPVEEALHDADAKDPEVTAFDPGPQQGKILAEVSGYSIEYAPRTQTNREAAD